MPLIIVILFFSILGHSYPYKRFHTAHESSPLTIRYKANTSRATDKATLLFLPGYSDQMGNHRELFDSLQAADIRVISFDYPGHGGSGGSISDWDLHETAELAGKILRRAKIDKKIPLVIMGFSAGGTMAARILQKWHSVVPRVKLAGAILMSPATPVKSTAGVFSIISEGDLTRGTLKFAPRPNSTFSGGEFTMSLLNQSKKVTKNLLPGNVPTVFILSDDSKDGFVKVRRTKLWIKKLKKKQKPVYAFQCQDAYHFLDVEPYGVAEKVIEITEEIVLAMAKGASQLEKWVKLAGQNKICPIK